MSNIFGGSKPAGNTTTIQSNEPWSGVQPYLSDLFSKAQSAYGANPAMSPMTSQGLGLLQNRAMGGNPLNQAAQAETMKTLQGGYADPYQQGALKDVMDMTRGQVNSQFRGDNFGNSAHQEWLQRGLLGASMPYASQAYNAERQRQQGAAAMAPGLANQDYTDINALIGAGQMGTQAPWDQLFNYQKAISGQGGGTSTTQQPYFNNGLGALGVGGGALGGFLMGGPMGAMIGGSLGGLLGR